MAFEITVDDESLEKFVRQYIETRVNEQIGIFLKHELKGVVEARLAKMNLTGKSIDIETIISEELREVIDKRIRVIMPELLKQELIRRFT